MEKLFKLKENGTNVRTEIIAGVTTFLSMVYILAVNPNILAAAGMDGAAVFTATAISAFFATLCMAFFANYPIALASGMGLNAYFAFSVCVPMAEQGINDPWKIALVAVLLEGIIFIILSFTNFREKLVDDTPENIKYAITSGIGLFITIIGLKGAGIVIASPATLVDLGSLASPQAALALIGLLIIAILYHFNIKGYILIAIVLTWGLGMIAQAIGWYAVDYEIGNFSLYPDFSATGFIPTMPELFSFDFNWIANHIFEFAVIVFSFLFVDIFDTVGTLIGISEKGALTDENGKLPNAKGALLADALGTVAGACLGTSTVTSYVESSAGVAEGGRTGLTALTTSILFLVALFLAPIFLAIPSFATTPALVWVGLLMMGSVKKMKFDGDIADVLGGFITLIFMPFTYSIANGIMFGILSWAILKVITGKAKSIPVVMWIAAVLFVFRLITLIHPISIV